METAKEVRMKLEAMKRKLDESLRELEATRAELRSTQTTLALVVEGLAQIEADALVGLAEIERMTAEIRGLTKSASGSSRTPKSGHVVH